MSKSLKVVKSSCVGGKNDENLRCRQEEKNAKQWRKVEFDLKIEEMQEKLSEFRIFTDSF